MKKITNNIRFINSAEGEDTIAVIDVIGDIGFDWWTGEGFTKDTVLKEFKGKKLTEVQFNISSLGGDYFEALAIKNMAVQTGAKIKVHYFGMVASAATEIGNSASKEDTTASSDFFILIHNTSTWAGGNKEEIIKTYETLAKFDGGLAKNYANKSGVKTADEFAAQMTKDTWMNADEALAWGLVGKLTSAQPISADGKKQFLASAEKLKIKTPEFISNKTTEDMAEKKSAQSIINEFFKGIKDAGMKLVSDKADEKPEDTTKKVKDLTDSFIKNVEENAKPEEVAPVENASADYTATVTVAVDSIELEDDSTVDLPNAPYELTADGATALATDLNAAITATSVEVVFDEGAKSLAITVKGTESVLKTVNGSIDFTKSNDGGATSNDADTLKKEIENLKKKKATALAEQKKVKNETEEVKKLRAQKIALQNEISGIVKGKSGAIEAKPEEETEEKEAVPGAGFVKNIFKSYQSKQ